MTEAEWLTCDDPERMFKLLQGKVSDRKLRLFAVACVRRIWGFLPDASRAAIEVSAQFADGRASEQELERAVDWAHEVAKEAYPGHGAPNARGHATSAAVDASSVWPHTTSNVGCATSCAALALACAAAEDVSDDNYDAVYDATLQAELAAQGELLRDIVGNPFRPAGLDPPCVTPAAISLATAAYDEQSLPSGHLDPARLAVLSDALEEAGCTGDVLAHLRSPGPHVRGCWALDLILGKS
jgi:hypothetical protein